jgi:hypothetical protein
VPGALLAHHRQGGPGEPDDTEEVGVDLGAEVVEVDVLDRADVGVSGVVDQHVEPPEAVDGGADRGAGGLLVGHVERDDGEPVAVLGGEVVQRLGAADAGDDLVTGVEDGADDLPAEAAGGAADQEDGGGGRTTD